MRSPDRGGFRRSASSCCFLHRDATRLTTSHSRPLSCRFRGRVVSRGVGVGYHWLPRICISLLSGHAGIGSAVCQTAAIRIPGTQLLYMGNRKQGIGNNILYCVPLKPPREPSDEARHLKVPCQRLKPDLANPSNGEQRLHSHTAEGNSTLQPPGLGFWILPVGHDETKGKMLLLEVVVRLHLPETCPTAPHSLANRR
jgi:hypothetical protein